MDEKKIGEAKAATYDVFLSYNSADQEAVVKVAERLKEAGLRIFFDGWVIKAGDQVIDELNAAIAGSKASTSSRCRRA